MFTTPAGFIAPTLAQRLSFIVPKALPPLTEAIPNDGRGGRGNRDFFF